MTKDQSTTELRRRVLEELARVEGHIALSERLTGEDAKQELRLAHGVQRSAALADATEFILKNEHRLLAQFANGDEVVPDAIDPMIIPVRTPADADLFRYASLQWSVPVSSGYGRRSRFLVRDRQNGKLMAIFALGDPVIAQSARDNIIGWTAEQRMRRLYNVYDAFVLGAMEPYRQLLAGKLVALLALANETRSFLVDKYKDNTTEIRLEKKDPTPALITTTSALGRSSIYNRLTFEGTRMFHSVGFTKGYGHFQFSDELFNELKDFVKAEAEANPEHADRVQSSTYGSGPNWKFRVIRNALQLLEIPDSSLQHNLRREVFVAPVAANWDSFLRGENDELDVFDLPAARIGQYYRERWAIPRAERMPGFRLWRRVNGKLSRDLVVTARQSTLDDLSVRDTGEVSLGAYLLRVGTEETELRGETIGRRVQDGSAYLSDLVGPSIGLTVADIQWRNGERELRGWSRHESPELYEQVINRLRIGVYPSEKFEHMSVMDVRLPGASSREGGRATAHRATLEELNALLGFDFAEALDGFGEVIVDSRESLLKDTSNRRRELCVVFPSNNLAVPPLVWALTRPIALGLLVGQALPLPGTPRATRRFPKRAPAS